MSQFFTHHYLSVPIINIGYLPEASLTEYFAITNYLVIPIKCNKAYWEQQQLYIWKK